MSFCHGDINAAAKQQTIDRGVPEEFHASEEELIFFEALALARQGIYVIPLHSCRYDGTCTCGRNGRNGKDLCDKPGKHPISGLLKQMYEEGLIQEISWKQTPTIDPEMIKYWFKAKHYANVGIPCTENDLLVLDFDNKPYEGNMEALKGWNGATFYEFMRAKFPQAFETVTVKTGSGGYHVYFRQPSDRKFGTCKVVEPIFEIRSYGAYVVGPKSRHKSGQRYEYEPGKAFGEIPVKTIPDELVQFIMDFRYTTGREMPLIDAETARKYNYLGEFSIKSREAKIDMQKWGGKANPDHFLQANRWLAKYLDGVKVHYRNDRAWRLACQLRDNGIPYVLAKDTMLKFINKVNDATRSQGDYHPYSVNRGLIQLINAYCSEPREPASVKHDGDLPASDEEASS